MHHPKQPVPVGTPVWFLQYGDDNDKPLAGTILQMSDKLVARVMYINPDGGTGTKMTVYPLGHESLKDQNGRPTVSASRNGAWTYHPMFVPKEETVAAKPAPKSKATKA